MQTGLVSLITPCYNTSTYLPKLLDSVFSDLDSVKDEKDTTANVVHSYISRFSKKGYTLRYVYQNNSGQSVAIKNGLSMVSGEFLVWPDSDDYYASTDAIELMVHELENASEDFQMVRIQERIIKDITGELIAIRGLDAHKEEDASLFEDCLFARQSFYFGAGAYMIRTRVLFDLTRFDIYTDKNAGQNWQLMLPILYKYRCKTILKPLYNVVDRESSHSRGQYRDYEAMVTKLGSYYRTQIETLKRIEALPRSMLVLYQKELSKHYNITLFKIALREHNRKAARERLLQSGINKGIKGYAIYVLLGIKGGGLVVRGLIRLSTLLK